ncbi:MAG TPA: glycerate kinase [Thermoleophilia bacterium]|nr:glycerate kinase [Thermoleophilia bacterium]
MTGTSAADGLRMQSSAGRVVVAPDKFKGSLSAAEAAARLAAGLRRTLPALAVATVPVADGGEGTVDAVVDAAGFRRLRAAAAGPTGRPVAASFAVKGETAVIETAQACGLALLPGGVKAALTATSYGAGELIRAALDAGCTRIVLGLGGSACTDGGAGLVQALGARLFDADGAGLPHGGAALARIEELDIAALRERLLGVEVIVACDVDNPLLGPSGAAAVYGPQKGASPEDVRTLDAALERWSTVVAKAVGTDEYASRPGAGAAGGIGFGALALLGARLRPGIELMLELAGFAEKARGARLVITGEGSLDGQSLRGKAPAGVARAASGLGVPVVAVCGVCRLDAEQVRAAGFSGAYQLIDIESDVARCVADAGALLERLAERIGREHVGGR